MNISRFLKEAEEILAYTPPEGQLAKFWRLIGVAIETQREHDAAMVKAEATELLSDFDGIPGSNFYIGPARRDLRELAERMKRGEP